VRPAASLAGLAILAILLPVPPAATADRASFGVGLGPGHHVDGDLARRFSSDGEVSGRFVLGLRRDNLAFEASFFGTDLHAADAPATIDEESLDFSTFSLGAGLKQYLPLSANVELYGRLGLDRTWLEPIPGRAKAPSFAGWGLDYGTGIEAGTSGPVFGVRGWIDLGRHHVSLRQDDLDATVGGTLTSITFGASIYHRY
jgi:hypothetical protein